MSVQATAGYEEIHVTSLKPGDVILVKPLIEGCDPEEATVTREPSEPFTDMYGRELITVWIQQGVLPRSHEPAEGTRQFLADGKVRGTRSAPPSVSPLITRIAGLAANGVYEPGQYARQGGLSAGELHQDGNGSVWFYVWTTVNNTDREQVRVTVSPA
jgi:hypothetical protein